MVNWKSATRTMLGVGLLVGATLTGLMQGDRGPLFDGPSGSAVAWAQTPPGVYDLASLSLFNRVVLQVRENYVDPARIDPDRMLAYALDRVQSTVPQVVALFDADLDEGPRRVEMRVGAQREVFELPPVQSVFEMSFRLRSIFRFLAEHLDPEETDLREVEYAAINGMLSTLDPHSVLLSPTVYREMRTANRGSFGGLGIVISVREGQLTIMSPIAGTPAAEQDLRSGDRIVRIDDESTINMTIEEAVQRLRGEPQTQVRLEISRTGWAEPHSYTLTRQIINIQSVRHQDLGNGIAYVRLNEFAERTSADLRSALAEMAGSEPLRGLVLDLRNNPGGLLQQAIRVSDAFLREGTIVTTVAGERTREENVANGRGTEPGYPIVVLVNPGSASASEIVAGALKAHGRAVVVGDRTFGKGSVQHLIEFADGSALKLTVAQYLTPGDESIQGVGIVPDIQLHAATITDDRLDLYPNEENRASESNYERSLTSDRLRSQDERPSSVLSYWWAPEPTDPLAIRDPDAFEMDFEIEFARQLLLASGETADRGRMLADTLPVIERTRQEQMGVLREELRARRVDWSPGDNVVQPVRMEVTTEPADGRVRAGDRISWTVTVTNDGTRPLHRVRAVSTSDYRLFDDREFVFGVVQPGESRSWTVDFDVSREDRSRVESIRFDAFMETIPLQAHTTGLVRVEGQPRPQFGLTYLIDDIEGGNGDGQLQVGESIRFVLDVTNIGVGESGETILALRNRSDEAIFLRAGRQTVEPLMPGGSARAEFSFEVRAPPEDGVVRLNLDALDTVFQEYLVEELRIPVTEARTTTPVQRWVAPEGPLLLRGAPASDAPPRLAWPSGLALWADRSHSDWTLIRWGGEMGWVESSHLPARDAAPGEETAPVLVAGLQPPTIEMAQLARETSEGTFPLTGRIRDDVEVLDWYVFVDSLVGPRRVRTSKRAYEYVGAPEDTFSTVVTLQPGMNRITLVARDNDHATSSEVLFVYRHP
jgi:carboxyl-terminal processing protease